MIVKFVIQKSYVSEKMLTLYSIFSFQLLNDLEGFLTCL